jgi:hypothetical protein
MYNFQELEVLYVGMKYFINTMPHSYRGTASFLNSQGYTTRRGKNWTGQHIKNMLTKSVVRFELSEVGRKRFAKLFTMVEDEEKESRTGNKKMQESEYCMDSCTIKPFGKAVYEYGKIIQWTS